MMEMKEDSQMVMMQLSQLEERFGKGKIPFVYQYKALICFFQAAERENREEREIIRAAAAFGARMLTGAEQEEDWIRSLGENESIYKIYWQVLQLGLEENPHYGYRSAVSMKKDLSRVRDCIEAYESSAYFGLYSSAYELLVPLSQMGQIEVEFQKEAYHQAVEHLDWCLVQSHIDYNRCNYIFSALWYVQERHREEISFEDKRTLIYSGIACAIHKGDSRYAISLYSKLEGKEKMGLEKRAGFINRIAGAYIDNYAFEIAGKMMWDNVQKLETHGVRKSVVLGRAYSGLGTAMVYAGWEAPLVYFERALEAFGEDRENQRITCSHVLHYAVYQKDVSLYRKYNRLYWKESNDLLQCFRQIASKEGSRLFDLWIFLKGVYAFEMSHIGDAFIQELRKLLIEDWLKPYDSFLGVLIYRYTAKILLAWNRCAVQEEVIDAYEKSMDTCSSVQVNLDAPLNIVMCMKYHTLWEYQNLLGLQEENKQLINQLRQHAEKSGLVELQKALEKEESLDKIFFFEHC